MKTKDDLVPFTARMPRMAYERIRQEAKRRKITVKKMFHEVIHAMMVEDYRHITKDPQLEEYGFYDEVDWDNEEQVNGVLIAAYVMQHLPPSLRELQ